MKSKSLFIGLFGLSVLCANAQNVQSNSLATSGGSGAGTTLTGSGRNTFYGYEAGKVSTTSGSNTFIGWSSGKSTTTNGGNTYVGSQSGSDNINGYANTFIGESSGLGNTTGHQNTYVGINTGLGNNSSHNSFFGTEAGYGSTGESNIYLGEGAGENAIGDGNLFLGNRAGMDLKKSNTFLVQDYLYYTLAPLMMGDFPTGKVGIGVTNFPSTAGSVDVSGYKFFVKGGLLAEEIRVATTWADYVFEKNYQLPTLKEVEQHIAEKGHLINVPSGKQIEQDGISVGEMAKIQQEKIEELTLYIIEQNKINEKQAEELKELKEMVKALAAKN